MTVKSPPLPLDTERDTLVKCVRRYGSAASDAILDPICKVFNLPDIDGVIGYRVDSSCAIVYGDPVCSIADTPALVKAFHDYCQKNKLNVLYIMTSERFAKWAMQDCCKAIIEFGEELVIDPHNDPKARHGTHASLVRRKVRHALKEGVEIKEYLPSDNAVEQAIESVSEQWLNARRGPQVHISHVYPFANRKGKRWFYAKKDDRIVGVVLLNQLEQRKGWLLNHLMHAPDAPHGTPEILLTTALDTLAQEDCHFVSFGPVPSEKIGEIKGMSKISGDFARMLYRASYRLFRLSGRKVFWDKFHPDKERSYLVLSKPHVGFREFKALVHALNIRFS